MQKMMPGAVSGVVAGDDASGLRQAAGHSMMPRNFLLDHVSPATRLLEKRRQMFEIQEALETQKEEFLRQDGATVLDLHKIHMIGQRSRDGVSSDDLIWGLHQSLAIYRPVACMEKLPSSALLTSLIH